MPKLVPCQTAWVDFIIVMVPPPCEMVWVDFIIVMVPPPCQTAWVDFTTLNRSPTVYGLIQRNSAIGMLISITSFSDRPWDSSVINTLPNHSVTVE